MAKGACVIVVAVAGCNGGTGTIECGTGTTLEGVTCVPVGLSCGAGTHEDNGTCTPDTGHFEIRSASMIRGDGWSTTEVRVFGTNPDGTPSHAKVALAANRVNGGELVSPSFVLDDLGGASNFVPCDSITPGCLGPLQLSVALASDPQTPVAHVDVELVAPPEIGSLTPCLGGGNILYFDGQNFHYNGPVTFSTDGTFDVFGGADRGVVHMVSSSGASWSLEFNTHELGIPLIPSVYENAQLPTTAPAGSPGFSLSGVGTVPTGCNPITDFEVQEFSYSPGLNDVTLLTATFTQHCDNDITRKLTGCVHYAQ